MDVRPVDSTIGDLIEWGAMETRDHIERLSSDARSFGAVLAEAAGAGDLDEIVVTCPDWTIRELALHLGGIHRWSTRLVADGVVAETWRFQMPIAYPGNDDEVAGWFVDGISPMIDAFSTSPVDRRVWVWGADPHARFWPRRMLHETAVHLADLLLTLGRAPIIDDDVAVDGLDEFLTNLPFTARWGAPLDGLRADDESIVLRASDIDATWRLRFRPTGFWWDRSDVGGDALVTGSVSDLYLFIQGRECPSIRITGRAEVVDRWKGALVF